jgi:parvulin-like peptidyl-prolyl isomerase
VGDVTIESSLVARVAVAERVPPSEALGRVIEDALAALGARDAQLDKMEEVEVAMTGLRARLMVQQLRETARAAGPPTDTEVLLVSREHWLEVDLPEQVRVIHAVVLEPKGRALEADAIGLATALAEKEASATSADDFEARAKALPHDAKIEIEVERLDPFVGDGRVATPGGGALDLDFVRGAMSLPVGATSGVVRSSFGWHVIRMIDRLPARRMPFEQRRALFEEEVRTIRGRRALEELEEALAKRHGVTLANGVEELMTTGVMTFLGVDNVPRPHEP